MNKTFQLSLNNVNNYYSSFRYNLLVTKRYAGGGGRPGGRPTFNWKEKRILGLDGKKLKPLKINPQMGNWDDIKDHFNPAKGDKIIELTKLETFEEDPNDLKRFEITNPYEGDNNTRKQIQISKLFGSNKSFGQLTNLGGTKFTGHKQFKRVFPRINVKTRSSTPFTVIESRKFQ